MLSLNTGFGIEVHVGGELPCTTILKLGLGTPVLNPSSHIMRTPTVVPVLTEAEALKRYPTIYTPVGSAVEVAS